MPEEPVNVITNITPAPNDIVGTWQGFIPCAGCPGITYNLVLMDDYTFQEDLEYEGEAPVSRTGTWRSADGVVELSGSGDGATRLSLSTAGELMMLDLAGKPVNAKYQLRRNPASGSSNLRALEGTGKIGVDFVATGHEPVWLLEIDTEKGIFFKTRPLEDIVLNTPLPKPAISGNTTTYTAKSELGELVVELTEQVCADAMSGKEMPFTVSVTANGKVYKGCGAYLGKN